MLAGICLSFFMNGTYAEVYAYTAEVFPTAIRTTGAGLASAIGRIVPEAWADLLVVEGNPLSDVSYLLGWGEHIPLVMKAGKMQVDRLNP